MLDEIKIYKKLLFLRAQPDIVDTSIKGMEKDSFRSGILFGLAYLVVVLVSATVSGNQLWPWSPTDYFSAFLVSIPGIAGAMLRHRWPRIAYGMTVVSAIGSFAIGTVVPIMLFLYDACYLTTVRWGLTHRKLILWGAAATTLCAFTFAYSAGGLQFAATMVFIFLIAAWIPIFWGLDIQSAHQLAEAERVRSRFERNAALAAIQNASDRTELLLAEERVRLASELHDTISSRLAAISLYSQAALADLENDRRSIVEQIRSEAAEALGEMKKQISLLRGEESYVETTPGIEELDELVARSEIFGQHVRLIGPPLKGLSPKTSRLVYRIVHEGLLNAAKHASATEVQVTWELRPEVLVIRISNAMPMTSPILNSEPAATLLPGTKLGLASLRERVYAAHGSFMAEVENGQWVISAELPNRLTDEPAFSLSPNTRSEV